MTLSQADGRKVAIRKLVRRFGILALWASGLIWWARRQLRNDKAVLVLMLHRVLTPEQKRFSHSEGAMVVGDASYHALIAHLRRHYRIIDPSAEKVEFSGQRLGIGITFDDGWQDNFTPVLGNARKHGVPSTIFVSPDLIGMDNPFWPERVCELLANQPEAAIKKEVETIKLLPPPLRARRLAELESQYSAGTGPAEPGPIVDSTMTWQQLKTLRQAGITIASHTMSHEILTSLPDLELVDRQLCDAKVAMEKELGSPCTVLAYPNGGHDDTVVAQVAKAGYARAFTVEPGAWTEQTDPLRVPRLNISDGRVSFSNGAFSAAAFEYSVIWRAYRAHCRAKAARAAQAKGVPSGHKSAGASIASAGMAVVQAKPPGLLD